MSSLLTQNQRLEGHILELKALVNSQKNVPPQIMLQRPVVLHDALGRIAPFHLEFISSAEALLAVLRVRFEQVGADRVRRLMFDLRETSMQKHIDIFGPWEQAFLVRASHIS